MAFFSGALKLTDLDDFISPSQACVLPPKVPVASNATTQNGGTPATISLTDCLACSGCITSAETILVTQQSDSELYEILKENENCRANGQLDSVKVIIVTLSEQTRASFGAKYGLNSDSILKRFRSFFIQKLKVDYVLDASFARDLTLLETAQEFLERYQSRLNHSADALPLPLLTSSCPGWICYAEKTHGSVLPFVSRVKSPQQVMGSLVKHYLPALIGRPELRPSQIYHVSVMPCYDKKLEASRSQFTSEDGLRDVDCVLATSEIEGMLFKEQLDIRTIPEMPFASPPLFVKTGLNGIMTIGGEGSSSGGYLSFTLRYAAQTLFGIQLSPLDVQESRNGVEWVYKQSNRGREKGSTSNTDFAQVLLRSPENPNVVLLRFAAAYGFKNIQNVVRKLKSSPLRDQLDDRIVHQDVPSTQPSKVIGSKEMYDFVEIMACPSGCINGGGQLKNPDSLPRDWIGAQEQVYRSTRETMGIQTPQENEQGMRVYSQILSDPKTRTALLHTSYQAVENKSLTSLGVKW